MSSLVADLFGVLVGQHKFTQTLERKMFQCVKTKFEKFLKSSEEFQSVSPVLQEIIWNRNVCLTSLFLGLLFAWRDTPEEQFDFYQNQVSSNIITNLITSFVKPKQMMDLKTIHEQFYPIFSSKEEEEYYELSLIDSKKMKNFHLIDLSILTLAILFHSEFEEHVSCTSYRNLLRILQERQQLKDPDFNAMNLYFEMIEKLNVFSTFEGFSRIWKAIK